MKQIYHLRSLLASLLAVASLVGCSSNDEELDNSISTELTTMACSATVAVTQATPKSVAVRLETVNMKEYAYVIQKSSESAPTLAGLFTNGTTGEITENMQTVEIGASSLAEETDYTIYFGFRAADNGLYETVQSQSFSILDGSWAELEMIDVLPGNVRVSLNVKNIKEYAYLLYKKEEAPDSAPNIQVINATGVSGNVVWGENSIRIGSAISPSTEYVLYFALTTVEDQFHEEVLTIQFTTSDVEGIVSLISAEPDGLIVNINIPESVTAAGNALKYTLVDYYTHYTRLQLDVESLWWNGQKHITESQTMRFLNSEALDYNDLDENGDPSERWNLMVPGEPVLFLVGEFSYMDTNLPFGWTTPGYHNPLFDWDGFMNTYGDTEDGGLIKRPGVMDMEYSLEDPFWTGYHSRHLFYTAKPEPMDKKVHWESIDPRSNGYTIRFTPDEGIKRMCFFILDESDYAGYTDLIGGAENWQWFVTSYAAFFQEGAQNVVPVEGSDVGITEITSDEIYISDVEPTPGVTYHIVLTAMGDEKGMTQSFLHDTFTLPDYTLPTPDVLVTPLTDKNTDSKVYFNIKSTVPGAPAVSARYVCNYVSEFSSISATYKSMLLSDSYSHAFSESDVAKINSEEGLEVEFSSKPYAATRLAVLVKNAEGQTNDPDKKDSPAVADTWSLRQADAPRVESELFDKLVGDWTATASVSTLSSGVATPAAEPRQVKVTIQGGIEYSDTFPSKAQENNPLWDTDEIASYWEQYKEEADAYNASVRGQNRLLCTGFGFENSSYFGEILELETPEGLFCRPDYSSSVANLFVRFGPKWYLQIAEGDQVTLPVNIETIGSLTSWSDGHDYYLMGWNCTNNVSQFLYYDPTVTDENGDKTLHFPVTVSDDCNTITINPFEYEGLKYYPSTTYFSTTSTGQAISTGTIITSPIVLTRGWSGNSAETSAKRLSAGPASTRGTAGVSATGKVAVPAKEITRLDRTRVDLTEEKPVLKLTKPACADAARERLHKRQGR